MVVKIPLKTPMASTTGAIDMMEEAGGLSSE